MVRNLDSVTIMSWSYIIYHMYIHTHTPMQNIVPYHILICISFALSDITKG